MALWNPKLIGVFNGATNLWNIAEINHGINAMAE